jgi:hypothetical protein
MLGAMAKADLIKLCHILNLKEGGNRPALVSRVRFMKRLRQRCTL